MRESVLTKIRSYRDLAALESAFLLCIYLNIAWLMSYLKIGIFLTCELHHINLYPLINSRGM
jgi:hypothetical protein